MQYTQKELQHIRDTSGDEFVVRVTRADNGRVTEDIAHDVDEALEVSAQRLQRPSTYCVEVFRITSNGTLAPTLGPTFSNARVPVVENLLLREGPVEIWEIFGPEPTRYLVYGVTSSGDPRVCPSLDMARSVAASAL